jgi:hypothetical protein
MLLGDLSNLNFADAALKQIIQQIQAWLDQHQRAKFLDPAVLEEELKVAPGELSRALMALVQVQKLRVRYKAMSPHSHSLTDKTFDSPLEIDEELYDSGENQFRREDAEIVPIFVEA